MQKKCTTSLSVNQATRMRAKYISSATDKTVGELATEAFKLLQDRYGLDDPPKAKVVE